MRINWNRFLDAMSKISSSVFRTVVKHMHLLTILLTVHLIKVCRTRRGERTKEVSLFQFCKRAVKLCNSIKLYIAGNIECCCDCIDLLAMSYCYFLAVSVFDYYRIICCWTLKFIVHKYFELIRIWRLV